MGSITVDSFINIFLDLLHYVPYIKDEKVKIQQFLGCLPPNFLTRIKVEMLKTFETTLNKARICNQHRKLWWENINRRRNRSNMFSDNWKPSFNPPAYRKQNNSFPCNKNFNKIGTKSYVPSPNANKPAENEGANVSLLQIKCWKCQGSHYARDSKSNTNGVLHNLKEEPMVEDIAGTPWIYVVLDGR